MKLFPIVALVLLFSSLASANCYQKKGISSPPPLAPTNVSMESGWNEAFADVFHILCKNLKTPNTLFRGYRAHPGPNYHGAYLWDSAFITQIWMYWDPHIAQEIVTWILKFQTKEGLLPHAVAEILVKPIRINDSQPPLLAWASWRIFERSHDVKFLAKVYPGLLKYHEWLKRERRHADGLYFWKTAYESGIDNSPRFADRKESWFDDTTKLASVDISSYVALSTEALAHMARVLNKAEDQVRLNQEYFALKKIMNEKLWDDQDGTYYDFDYRKLSFVKFNTISNLTPMVAGIPDEFKAARLMRDIMDQHRYHTLIPFPSVARDDKSFVKDMWRGPVWINMAYLGVLGVQRYGYHKEASELSHAIVKGVFETWKNTGEFYEFYDPERYDIKELTRKKGNLWKRLTLGSKPVKELVGWSGLTNTLIYEFGESWK